MERRSEKNEEDFPEKLTTQSLKIDKKNKQP